MRLELVIRKFLACVAGLLLQICINYACEAEVNQVRARKVLSFAGLSEAKKVPDCACEADQLY